MDTASAPAPKITVQPRSVSKKNAAWSNLFVGALVQIFQCTTLGQPLEVLKTHVAANRTDTLGDAVRKTWARGGVKGFYQGLIPWAWVEASTKGSILILASTEVEDYCKNRMNCSSTVSGMAGGVAGGAAQAYLTMGFTTCMKTIEVTRSKALQAGVPDRGTTAIFVDILKTKGIRGVYRGVNAVALRQITGWSSRIGISRYAESQIRLFRGKAPSEKLSFADKVLASAIGGGFSCWNQPFEVLRVEMQSMVKDPNRPKKLTMASTARHIIRSSGLLGLFRGAVPRIAVGMWSTVCMVGLGDLAKDVVSFRTST